MLTPHQLGRLRQATGRRNRLKKAIELAGLTQYSLAERSGLTQAYISKLCNGRYSKLPTETASKLAGLIGCDVVDLFPEFELAATRGAR